MIDADEHYAYENIKLPYGRARQRRRPASDKRAGNQLSETLVREYACAWRRAREISCRVQSRGWEERVSQYSPPPLPLCSLSAAVLRTFGKCGLCAMESCFNEYFIWENQADAREEFRRFLSAAAFNISTGCLYIQIYTRTVILLCWNRALYIEWTCYWSCVYCILFYSKTCILDAWNRIAKFWE